jgi:transposase
VGLRQRMGDVVIRRLEHVPQATIEPLMRRTIAPGTVVDTEAYDSDARRSEGGDPHPTVGHAAGEWARDDEGDGGCEGPVNTLEGFWALLRSWRHPHRGLSQEKRPISVGCFACVPHVRRRGQA